MYIGIDLGGTNIACGLTDGNGVIIEKQSLPTLKERDFSEIVDDMAALCKRVTKDAGFSLKDVKAVGIGSPGSIDNKRGIIRFSPNIYLENAPLADMFKERIDKPVNIENDANAAAYGEYAVNGNGAKSFVFITLGTGVGGGIVLDGKLYRGFNGAGAELGHTVIVKDGEPCGCGRLGCWEAYASVTALIRQTVSAMEKHPESIMHSIAGNGMVSGKTAFEAARKGDAAAKRVVHDYCEYVGTGLANILNIFQPECIVIGGGISKEGDCLLAPVREYAYKNDYNRFMKKTEIKTASLYNDAGIIGAAMAAKSALGL